MAGIDEILSILDYSKFNNAVFSVFTNISVAHDYWTSTVEQNSGTDMVSIELVGPTIVTEDPASGNLYAICVRGDAFPARSFTRDPSFDIVIDGNTGLQWQDDADPGIVTQTDAVAACAILTLGGHTDWRMPNARELLTITDMGNHYNPVYDNAAFTNYRASDDLHWSSTVTPFSTTSAWDIDMLDGSMQTDTRDLGANRSYRCVRGGFSE